MNPSISDPKINFPASFNQTEYAPPTHPFQRVTLEMSLKPFYDTSPETREAVCRNLFMQWLPLCKDAERVSVLLWIGDGSEMLEFTGDMTDTFEWACWLGSVAASMLRDEEESVDEDHTADDQGLGLHGASADPNGIGLHRHAYLYRENPARFTYTWLKDLIADLKRIGREITGKPVAVGEPFDPGPEFSRSAFKYERHPEILGAIEFTGGHFAYCATTLKRDDHSYAAFPDGIPEGTHLGTFLGRQSKCFFEETGFDFLWFSNGFGFGSETLTLSGKLFDGKTFTPEQTREYEAAVYEFWERFRAEAPEMPLRMRGSNLTAGVDLASDAVPLNRIYKECGNIDAPVNSPWAAMDGDFGLEFAGWMSHIAELPNEEYPFRFYANDPWWMNSPWLDRYERSPHDIYMPLSICRLKEDGSAHTPETVAFLTCDNSLGQLPDQVAADVSAHIIRARENKPDAAGPLVWIYPWDEYHQMTFSDDPQLQEVYFGDWYVRGIINQGFPLNTVISTGNFMSATVANSQWLGEVLFVSTSSSSAVQEKVLAYVAVGGRAIFYGPLTENTEVLASLLGVEATDEIEGDFEIRWSDAMSGQIDPAKPTVIHHPSTFSGGGLRHRGVETESVEEIATACRGNETRSLARLAQCPEWNGGMLGWLRGGVSCDETKINQFLPVMLSPEKVFQVEQLARLILDRVGLHHGHVLRRPSDRAPLLTVSRSRNAYIISGYNPDEADVSIRLPLGAPVLTSQHPDVENGKAFYRTPTAWHGECRVLLEQEEASRIDCKDVPSIMAGVRRRLMLTGLKSATVRFFPVPGTEDVLAFLRNPSAPFIVGDFIRPVRVESPEGIYYEAENISGRLLISW